MKKTLKTNRYTFETFEIEEITGETESTELLDFAIQWAHDISKKWHSCAAWTAHFKRNDPTKIIVICTHP